MKDLKIEESQYGVDDFLYLKFRQKLNPLIYGWFLRIQEKLYEELLKQKESKNELC